MSTWTSTLVSGVLTLVTFVIQKECKANSQDLLALATQEETASLIGEAVLCYARR